VIPADPPNGVPGKWLGCVGFSILHARYFFPWAFGLPSNVGDEKGRWFVRGPCFNLFLAGFSFSGVEVMKRFWLIGAAAIACVIFALDPPAHGQVGGSKDSIRTHSEGLIHGNVESTTHNEVTVSTGTGIERTLQVDDLEQIIFVGEPESMRLARSAANAGKYAQALKLIDKLDPNAVDRELVRTELEYLKIVFKIKLAINSETDSDDEPSNEPSPADLTATNSLDVAKENPVDLARAAGPQLVKFLKDHPNTFHYYEGNELAGNLLVWWGNIEQNPNRFAAATTFYEKLAESPWPDFKARADLLRARQLLLQGKNDAALAAYDAALAVKATGPLAESQTQEAVIGRTYCLVGTNKTRDALKILQDFVAKADDDDTVLLARAYCALGNCYRAMNENQQALWAYLRVHVEYPSVAESHAEALANLETLWANMRRPDRAREAHDYLVQHYPFSRWSKRTVAH
jgi:tetratricopeptide (TPR) repeat protein